MTNTVKYVLIGTGSLITTAAVSAISYVKGKKDGIALGMKQSSQLPANASTDRQQHAHA